MSSGRISLAGLKHNVNKNLSMKELLQQLQLVVGINLMDNYLIERFDFMIS